jgi:3-oxoacyl-[acyl-carrier protein] reductase
MRAKGGSIINIGSVVGISGNAGQSNYSASKAGMIGFTKSFAKELASRNIRANVVAPGYILTDMTGKLDEKVLESIKKETPLGRAGNAEEVSNVVAFLASDLSSYITGEVIRVDGGMAM